MSAIKTTVTGYVGYRGREGHWSFLLHRITGLGTGLFLTLHIVDIGLLYFAPALFQELIGLYTDTVFALLEIALVYAVIYHGLNGLRIAYFDMIAPRHWNIATERKTALWTFILSLVLFVPAGGYMFYHILYFNYGLFH